jgi:hypothetical protein
MIFIDLKDQLKAAIETAYQLGKAGKRAKASKELRKIYELIVLNPFLFWEDVAISQLGKCFILILHYEIFDDEETNIRIAHYTYLFITRAIELIQNEPDLQENSKDRFFLIYKDRILLVNTFSDSFTHTIARFFQKKDSKPTEEEIKASIQLANQSIPLIVQHDLLNLEILYDDFKNDPFLIETANNLEARYSYDRNKINDAAVLHKLLYNSIRKKVLENDLVF